jgi:hypothetical protein
METSTSAGYIKGDANLFLRALCIKVINKCETSVPLAVLDIMPKTPRTNSQHCHVHNTRF